MKVIFLDHYGVMCLADAPTERTETSLPSFEEIISRPPFSPFSRDAVAVVNAITAATGADIVVSSDWKSSLEDMQNFYVEQGLKAPVARIDVRPGGPHEARSASIMSWVGENRPDRWVAVDDLCLTLKNFVWCRFPHEGITGRGIKERIISHLE